MKLNYDQFNRIMNKFPDEKVIFPAADKVVFYRTYQPTPTGDKYPVDHYLGMASDPDEIKRWPNSNIPENSDIYISINGHDYLMNIDSHNFNSNNYGQGYADGYEAGFEDRKAGLWR